MDTRVDRILFLQRTVGNQAVQRLLRSGALQAKLRIGQPGDMYEQEADRVADAVMRMPEPGVQRQVELEEEEEEEQIQTKPVIEQITPLVQKQVEEEEEEQVQTMPITAQITPLVQRQVEEEEEVQTKPVTAQITPLVQRQVEEEEEVQTKPVTAQITPLVQRQVEEEVQTEPITELITPLVQRKVREEEEEELQAKTTSGRIPEVQPNIESHIHSLKGGGQPLSKNDRAFFEPRFGRDFSQMRVHTDTRAGEAARVVNARAFTVGQDVVFGGGQYSPGMSNGKRLIAHELTHVVQQRKEPRSTISPENRAQKSSGRHLAVGTARVSVPSPIVQRKIVPEDVAAEIIGREFEVTGTFNTTIGTTLKTGDRVMVVSWDNTSDSVSVFSWALPMLFIIPKRLLKPTRTAVAGVAPYSAGVTAQAAAVKKNKKELAAWIAKESSYKTKSAVELFKKERKRLEGLLAKRRKELNKKLIQETMFNRFDATIKKEVDTANKAHGLRGSNALDPNLVKSMLFQESQLGTAGKHLEVPPSHPVKTRFNIGQVIDSSGLALMTLLEKEQPVLITALLPSMRKDLKDAQKERKTLKGKKKLTPIETVRLAELNALAVQNWETFIWSYQSPGLPIRFADVVNSLFASQSPALNVDYKFWIHLAVFWLFEKHKPGRSWPNTIRAYIGTGARAKHYQKAIVKRAKSAASAAKASKEFIPRNI